MVRRKIERKFQEKLEHIICVTQLDRTFRSKYSDRNKHNKQKISIFNDRLTAELYFIEMVWTFYFSHHAFAPIFKQLFQLMAITSNSFP